MPIAVTRRIALLYVGLGMLLVGPARAEDLVSSSYRLRGLHAASVGPGWLTSTSPTPSISAAGVSLAQSEAIGNALATGGLEASWSGFWPLVAGGLPTQDRDGDGITDVTEISTSGPGTDPLDPDSDDDGLCDGPPSALPACSLGGEDLDGDHVFDIGLETNPNDRNTDDDAWTDGVEIQAGTNPLDPASHPPFGAAPALNAPALWLLVAGMGLIGIAGLPRRNRA